MLGWQGGHTRLSGRLDLHPDSRVVGRRRRKGKGPGAGWEEELKGCWGVGIAWKRSLGVQMSGAGREEVTTAERASSSPSSGNGRNREAGASKPARHWEGAQGLVPARRVRRRTGKEVPVPDPSSPRPGLGEASSRAPGSGGCGGLGFGNVNAIPAPEGSAQRLMLERRYRAEREVEVPDPSKRSGEGQVAGLGKCRVSHRITGRAPRHSQPRCAPPAPPALTLSDLSRPGLAARS